MTKLVKLLLVSHQMASINGNKVSKEDFHNSCLAEKGKICTNESEKIHTTKPILLWTLLASYVFVPACPCCRPASPHVLKYQILPEAHYRDLRMRVRPFRCNNSSTHPVLAVTHEHWVTHCTKVWLNHLLRRALKHWSGFLSCEIGADCVLGRWATHVTAGTTALAQTQSQ